MTLTQQKIDADRINAVRVGVEAFVKAAACDDVIADVITNHVEALVKQAGVMDSLNEFGNQALDWVKNNPELAGAGAGGLAGAGIGGLIGGGKGALIGGLGGAGLGAGAGYGVRNLLPNDFAGGVAQGAVAGAGSGMGGTRNDSLININDIAAGAGAGAAGAGKSGKRLSLANENAVLASPLLQGIKRLLGLRNESNGVKEDYVPVPRGRPGSSSIPASHGLFDPGLDIINTMRKSDGRLWPQRDSIRDLAGQNSMTAYIHQLINGAR